jgi:glycosyltransferase involved in cell wall biosynthesis
MKKVAFLTNDNREVLKKYEHPDPMFGTAPAALLGAFAALPEVEVHVVSCVRRPVHSPPKLFPNIYYHSLVVPKIGWMRTGFLGCIMAVRRKLRELAPDIVHGQGTEGDCSISAVFSGFPNVITIHGNMRLIARVTRPKPLSYPWLAAKLEGFTIPRSHGVVCITNHTRAAVQGLARKTWVVPNAVDPSFFDIARPEVMPAVPLILYVGHISFLKNQNAFIRALDTLARRRSFKLLFLGQTSPGRGYDDEFLALVKERSWCGYSGFADRATLKNHFREASIVALPSLEDNCPMVILEGMASGVAPMASKVGGIPDLIEESRSGLFCDPLNAASMAGGIERLLSETGLASKIGAQARISARARFHPDIIGPRHLEIYREVLGEKPED